MITFHNSGRFRVVSDRFGGTAIIRNYDNASIYFQPGSGAARFEEDFFAYVAAACERHPFDHVEQNAEIDDWLANFECVMQREAA